LPLNTPQPPSSPISYISLKFLEMKKLFYFSIVSVLIISCSSPEEAENSLINNGTYTNDAGQNLIIENLTDSSFDFTVTWGENDEWGCLFSEEGTALLTSDTFAYFGYDDQWPDIEFNIKKDAIQINGGLEYIGMDCAKYGSSWTDDYTLFYVTEQKDQKIQIEIFERSGIGYDYEGFPIEEGEMIKLKDFQQNKFHELINYDYIEKIVIDGALKNAFVRIINLNNNCIIHEERSVNSKLEFIGPSPSNDSYPDWMLDVKFNSFKLEIINDNQLIFEGEVSNEKSSYNKN